MKKNSKQPLQKAPLRAGWMLPASLVITCLAAVTWLFVPLGRTVSICGCSSPKYQAMPGEIHTFKGWYKQLKMDVPDPDNDSNHGWIFRRRFRDNQAYIVRKLVGSDAEVFEGDLRHPGTPLRVVFSGSDYTVPGMTVAHFAPYFLTPKGLGTWVAVGGWWRNGEHYYLCSIERGKWVQRLDFDYQYPGEDILRPSFIVPGKGSIRLFGSITKSGSAKDASKLQFGVQEYTFQGEDAAAQGALRPLTLQQMRQELEQARRELGTCGIFGGFNL